MRVVYLGTPAVAVPPLRALLASRHEVVAVVTRPDRPRDRAGGRPSPSPVKLVAVQVGLPVLQPERGRDPDLPAQLAALGADAGVTCAFGLLLPRPVLDAFPRGVLNLHFSLLPAYRGAAPVQRALLDGVTVTGVSTFQLDEGMDTGPMLLSAEVPVAQGEDAGALTARLAEVGAELVVQTLDALEAGAITPRPQPESGASLAPKVSVDDARLDFAGPAARVLNAVRAFTPAPGAWTTMRGKRLKVLAAAPTRGTAPPPGVTATHPTEPDTPTLAPGELALGGDGTLLAGTADAPVRLERVQLEGKRAMAGAELARGLRLTPGERLGQ